MSTRSGNVKLKELLAAIEEIRKDISYTRSLQERWQKERQRFPILYEYVGRQSNFFWEKMETLLEAEVKEESLDAYVRWRLQQVGKQPEGGEKESGAAAGLQALESAAEEVAKLRQHKEQEDAERLAEKVRQDEVKNADRLDEPGTQIADELEKREEDDKVVEA